MPSEMLEQFVSTFKEWHYFIGGGSLGFVVGLVAALIWFVAYRGVTDAE